MVIAFYCTMFIKIGTGPLWNEKVGEEVERCRESWWANLLYVNNYVKPQKLVSTNIINTRANKRVDAHRCCDRLVQNLGGEIKLDYRKMEINSMGVF
jgi:hypothetical protein